MAHQAHAIPWRTFASNFAYTTRPHISNLPELYLVENAHQLKDLQHFVSVFAKRIREFGVSERAKYAPSESFKQRAKSWKKSDMDSEDGVPEIVSENRGNKNGEEQRKSGKKSGGRDAHVERRKVYPDAFKAKYENKYDRWDAYNIEARQDISGWIDAPSSYDGFSCIDTIKMLLMEAAAASHPISERVEGGAGQKHAMESLLLLAHKIEEPILRSWRHCGGGAHNYGIETVAEKALDAYLMFNLFFSMRESGSKICEMVVGPQPTEGGFNGLAEYVVPRDTETLRPRYMHTQLRVSTVKFVASSNYYNSEQLMHRAFLFPQWDDLSEKPETVRDVMSEGEGDELREYLKGLWRVFVAYEVFWKEVGIDVDWEDLLSKWLWMWFRVEWVVKKETAPVV